MFDALILATATLASPAPMSGGVATPAPHYCAIASQSKNVNLPPDRTDEATNVAHASTVFANDEFVGFLYRTNGGALWYQDGLIGRNNVHTGQEDQIVLRALDVNLRHVGVGSITKLSPAALSGLIDGRITVKPCY